MTGRGREIEISDVINKKRRINMETLIYKRRGEYKETILGGGFLQREKKEVYCKDEDIVLKEEYLLQMYLHANNNGI